MDYRFTEPRENTTLIDFIRTGETKQYNKDDKALTETTLTGTVSDRTRALKYIISGKTGATLAEKKQAIDAFKAVITLAREQSSLRLDDLVDISHTLSLIRGTTKNSELKQLLFGLTTELCKVNVGLSDNIFDYRFLAPFLEQIAHLKYMLSGDISATPEQKIQTCIHLEALTQKLTQYVKDEGWGAAVVTGLTDILKDLSEKSNDFTLKTHINRIVSHLEVEGNDLEVAETARKVQEVSLLGQTEELKKILSKESTAMLGEKLAACKRFEGVIKEHWLALGKAATLSIVQSMDKMLTDIVDKHGLKEGGLYKQCSQIRNFVRDERGKYGGHVYP